MDRYIWAANATVPDSAIASAAGQTGTNAYTGKLSKGMPVQTLSSNVFHSAAQPVTPRTPWGAMGVGLVMALAAGTGGWVTLASRF